MTVEHLMPHAMTYNILLTFDIEDWFQVENLKQCIPFSAWPTCELRVERNTHLILDLLDSIKVDHAPGSRNSFDSLDCNSAKPKGSSTFHSKRSEDSRPHTSRAPAGEKDSPPPAVSASCSPLRATFFVLGWIAKRLPHLVREIQFRGHEVASHGYDHVLCREQSAEDLKADLSQSKKLLEDTIGAPIYGYRAPGFSVDRYILGLIEGADYLYDSSFNSFRLNRRYGQIDLDGKHGDGILHKITDSFYEFPITNLKIGRQVLPWGGGGYFRLIPTGLFRLGVRSILKKQGGYLFYMHPWEIDSDQPRVSEIGPSFRFRHYLNLDKTYRKLSMFLKSFGGCRFPTCVEFLQGIDERTPGQANKLE